MQDTRKGRSKGALFVRLPHPLREQIVVLAAQEHRTLTGQITLMLEQWLAQREQGILRAVAENAPLLQMAEESVQLAQEQGTDGWPTLEEMKQEATVLAQELRQARRELTGDEPE